jgi:hypothetical protein
MTIYSCVLFLHIMGAFTLFVAIGLEWVGLARLRAARTTALVREWTPVLALLDTLVPTGAALILSAGLYMGSTVWRWGNAWIDARRFAQYAPVNSGPKMAENQRFEIAATATTFRRSHGGKQRLDGVPCQGRQPPEAGAKGQPLQGTPSSQT